jgi:NTE family protein
MMNGIELPPDTKQIVLVLQGGGALGAYQAGVYQALHEVGIEPTWVIGTSIGAINASLIAGNEPADRLERLKEFWRRVQHGPFHQALSSMPLVGSLAANWFTMAGGIADFFKPQPMAFAGVHMPLGAEAAAYYSTAPLETTLGGLVNFERINRGETRLTVGAANVRTSEMRYFDGELYWDGGILSNTPVEAVFDDDPRRNSLVFAVHIWNPHGSEPETIWQVMNRQKDIQYSSRAISHVARQKQLHRLRHVVSELVKRMPESERQSNVIRDLAEYGCLTRMHVVRLLAQPIDGEDHMKDIDFSAAGICARWEAGLADTRRVIAKAPWHGEFDPIEGVILHEARAGTEVSSG